MDDHHFSYITKFENKENTKQKQLIAGLGKELGTMLLLFRIVKRIQ
jgi:hypothetical protein